MLTQEVSDVKLAEQLAKTTNCKEATELLISAKVEACSEYSNKAIPCDYHPFIASIHNAYAEHRPLTVSPDMFWILIAQGFANHVNMNSEEMRHYFVEHEGKKQIVIQRDNFLKGSPENDWAGCFEEFSEEIRKEIGDDNHKSIVVGFSTTGRIEKAASEVVLMDSMQSYFEFGMMTCCGIPFVNIEGTAEDWGLLYERTENLGKKYGLGWWTEGLLLILEQIVDNVRGKDNGVWQDIYKENSVGSGAPYSTGWIVEFLPYLQFGDNLRKNPFLGDFFKKDRYLRRGPATNNWPSGVSKVPFTWNYNGTIYEMELIAGFTSLAQDEDTMALKSRIGWAVRDKEVVPLDRYEWWQKFFRGNR